MASGPHLTPLEVIKNKHFELFSLYERLLVRNDALERAAIDLNKRLDDALDRVHELETKIREKDALIEELQEMNRTRRDR